jgi:hypothetical protein
MSDPQEMTDPLNRRVLATLSSKTWHGLAVCQLAADWWRPTNDLAYLEEIQNPLGDLIQTAMESSGAIQGKHRGDLRDVLIGSPQQSLGLSLPIISPQAPAGPQEANQSAKPRRGF